MTFARPEPDLRRVRVFLKWHMARGDADLNYAVDRREPATRVHGFPLCAGPLSTGSVMTGRGDARNVSAAYCDGGGYATGIATRPDAFPRLYGWKPVGEVQGRVVYKRRGRFVEASSKLDGTLGRVLNVVRFDGRHDPRGRH